MALSKKMIKEELDPRIEEERKCRKGIRKNSAAAKESAAVEDALQSVRRKLVGETLGLD